jgi:threonine/homoserine/homoserine lactone efflux protein
MLTLYFLPIISLGLSAVAIPGPLQTNLLNVTLRYGRAKSMLLVLSPLISDAVIAPLVLLVLGQLPPIALDGIRIFGGLFLLWLVWNAIKQFRAGVSFGEGQAKEVDSRRLLRDAVVINFLTPGPYIFWATLVGPLILRAIQDNPLIAVVMVVLFYIIFIGGLVLFVFVFDKLGSISPTVTRWIMGIAILLMAYFSFTLLFDGTRNLIGALS